MSNFYFPKQSDSNPRIYVYELPNSDDHKGLLKIGYTTRTVTERIHEQLSVLGDIEHNILLDETAIKNDGQTFTDKDIHRYLDKQGVKNVRNEWYKCGISDVQNAIVAIRDNKKYSPERIHSFGMRPEQVEAIETTAKYFKSIENGESKPPKFLWNAKMRFGKTFTAYQLAKKMKWKRVLVLTFKPAVQSAWQEDLETHTDFEYWEFISKDGKQYNEIDKNKSLVWFSSLQNVLGKNSVGGIKVINEDIHTIHWDCIIFDEYHYGAWRENTKELVETESKSEQNFSNGELTKLLDENSAISHDIIPIKTKYNLYLSGTPFKALESAEFMEWQTYNWTYTDEQKAKIEWDEKTKGENPYKSLPRMVMMTYDMPEEIKQVARDTDFNEFDLNIFFKTNEQGAFIHETYVQKWLDLIRGNLSTTINSKKAGVKTPPLPFSDPNILSTLNHTFWYLPSISSCNAMEKLLHQPHNKFFTDYTVINCAGSNVGIGVQALPPVQKAMGIPTETKTITLSCGKLTTGVSVKPWGGIFMLRNMQSPESYFQSAFRVQTPWEITDDKSPNQKEILKHQCYVFDFAPNRALRQIYDYGCRLDTKLQNPNPEKQVKEFIKFLPILAYMDGTMTAIDARAILEKAVAGVSSSMLVRKWESALLVNLNVHILEKLLASEQAMNALMNLEGFRNLNKDLEIIISKSKEIKEAKEKANKEDIEKRKAKKINAEDKKNKKLIEQYKEKLIKFAARIPIFMYLSDHREQTLHDVITKLEPSLFKKVTGLTVDDFKLLNSLGLFNNNLMNEAVLQFKLSEDASLSYTGIEKMKNENLGGWETIVTKKEAKEILK